MESGPENPRLFSYPVRVRYADVDQMGVAYHSRYLEWFEAARTEMLREMGIPYKELEVQGFLLPVIEVSCSYRIPARYDEMVEVRTTLAEVSRLKISLAYEVWNPEKALLLATGRTLHCFADRNGKPRRAEPALIERLTPFLRGSLPEEAVHALKKGGTLERQR